MNLKKQAEQRIYETQGKIPLIFGVCYCDDHWTPSRKEDKSRLHSKTYSYYNYLYKSQNIFKNSG